MKNNRFFFSLLFLGTLALASCSSSRGYGTHRKGYGCPSTTSVPANTVEKKNV